MSIVLGPVLGGYLAENLSWRGVFFTNVPLAVAVLAIAFQHVPETRNPGARRLDLPGATLAAVVLGVGIAAQAPAVTTVALGSVDARRSGLASTINNAFSQTAALLAGLSPGGRSDEGPPRLPFPAR